MKKFIVLTILALAVTGMISAQAGFPGGPWGRGGWGTTAETTTVAGTIQIQNGVTVVVSGNTTYYVPMLMRYAGLIDGIKEGAQISMEGFADINMFMPTAFTVAGKQYDLSTFASANRGGFGNMGGGRNWGGGRGGRRGGGWGQGGCCW